MPRTRRRRCPHRSWERGRLGLAQSSRSFSYYERGKDQGKISEFVRICGRGELPPEGEAREFAAGPKTVCVANVAGEISALDNVCPHRGGPLGQGIVENGKVVCPWHAYAFDVKTGALEHDPREKIAVYQIRLEGDDVLVKL